MSGSPNAELAYRVLDHIEAHPEQHHQGSWWRASYCGSSGCYAGWAVHLSGETPGRDLFVGDVFLSERAAQLLGFEDERDMNQAAFEALGQPTEEEFELFSGANSRADLGRIIGALFGPRPEPTA